VLTPLLVLSTACGCNKAPDKPQPVKVAGTAGPQDKPQPDPVAKSEAAERLQALQEEMQKARGELIAKYNKAEKDEEKQALREQVNGVGRSFAGRFLELAQKYPGDPAAAQALVFILVTAADSPQAETAAEIVVKNHLGDPNVLALVPRLGDSTAPAAETVLRGVMEHAKDKADQGKAAFALAQSLKERVGKVREVKASTPDQLQQLKARLGEQGLKRLQEADPAKLEAEAEKLFEQIAEKYADVRERDRTLGEMAKAELHELRHLAVGKPAPEIEAEDIDGQRFKLSDYRGKVVLLDFWGHW
jgi:hypothetical protein